MTSLAPRHTLLSETSDRPDLSLRVRAGGKFLYAGEEKLYLNGVTYGTFSGEDDLPPRATVERDFALMAQHGINTVRVYTAPPRWLLDLAFEHALRVLVGLPWEQHVTFLDDRATQRSAEDRVRAGVRASAGHPAVLGYLVGNEIPTGIVRWHGGRRIERYIERLYKAAKDEAPDAVVSYANYPSTEYLDLPFLDMVCFNVFLEREDELRPYFGRLQTLAGDRPLVITELGLDSHRHGHVAQASSVARQLRLAYESGAAGCCVFSWTDEWSRGGHDVQDWKFGLVNRERVPKPALPAVRDVYADVPLAPRSALPSVSVIVCTHNGASRIEDCLTALAALDYPRYEVVVVDDGSSDGTAELAEEFDVKLIRTANRGLSCARNTGIAASSGEIVAFCDDDCRPDPHWLLYLASALVTSSHAGVGGPNIPPEDGLVAESVGHAPGGPMHVLVSDYEAEHIPGCNMAFRRSVLDRVGGFDPQFHVAGDDVDLCWRIQNAGGTLGFSPGALVWHRARRSVRAYLRQQVGYGRAEALLERKWPERYNDRGHVEWGGRVQGARTKRLLFRQRWRVYYGSSGSALFQSVYQSAPSGTFPVAPEWYLLFVFLAAASIFGFAGQPLIANFPGTGLPVTLILLMVTLGAISARAAAWALTVVLPYPSPRWRRFATRWLVFVLCLLQPVARLWGRSHRGLTPWRHRGPRLVGLPFPRTVSVWSEYGHTGEEWLMRLERRLRPLIAVEPGNGFDRWDLRVRTGPLAAATIRIAVEEHGWGRQMLRFRARPSISRSAVMTLLLFGVMIASALIRGAVAPAAVLGGGSLWMLCRTWLQATAAVIVPARVAASVVDEPEPEALGVSSRAVPSLFGRKAPRRVAPRAARAPRRLGQDQPTQERV